eukprot:CAMPEP_0180117330 /NCGR_PEP_ID=MMETSP0986-20121125/862_1 /TAXON_ID=697907 /ORGANISM="non described non described, Strain CCMP2293" /LENGTH=108 /DNA_ID=CAMNT_0022056199 /DNA_START=208 /DNA_END=531 /DNA_ORIENTATION=-
MTSGCVARTTAHSVPSLLVAKATRDHTSGTPIFRVKSTARAGAALGSVKSAQSCARRNRTRTPPPTSWKSFLRARSDALLSTEPSEIAPCADPCARGGVASSHGSGGN